MSHFESIDQLRIKLPLDPTKMQGDRRDPSELSLAELSDFIARGVSSGIDVLSYRVDYHSKGAFYFASFVVSLIGLKFGYRSERSMETARSILLAIGLGISYWVILSAGRALGNRGSLPPWFSAWMANFIIIGISWVSILRARRG
jgi:lipopolysaccharide export system permease protein